jgi:hypothetical protein
MPLDHTFSAFFFSLKSKRYDARVRALLRSSNARSEPSRGALPFEIKDL